MQNNRFWMVDKLFQLTILLLPTQLAYHFWPEIAFVNGIRVDYLSPALYLTDLLIIVFIVLSMSFFTVRKKIINLLINQKSIILILSAFVTLNVIFAHSPFLALINWLKIILFSIFALVIVVNKNINVKKLFPFPYFLSVLIVVGLQVLQFFNNSSIGGLFYFLGERTFDTNTIGIALTNIFGKNYLRPYSTFPHPNALGGYLLVGSFLFFSAKKYIDKKYYSITLILSAIGIILSFSQMVWIASLILILIYFFKLRNLKPIFIIVTFVSFAQLLLPYYLVPFFSQDNIVKRIELLDIAGNMISDNYFLGVGLSNFIPLIPYYSSVKSFWFLQPVHNIIVLLLAELGFVGLLVIYKLYKKYTQLTKKPKIDYLLKLSLLGVLLSGFADHYWLTLQQNMLLLTLLIAFSLRESSYAEK